MITQFPLGREYLHDVSRGKISGAQNFGAYGEVTTVGASSGVLWPNGVFSFPSSAGEQVKVVSSSASDTAAGTGVRTVVLLYLDSDLEPHTETVTLNGTTAVNTVATNIRFLQGMYAATFGSGKAAAGNISVTNSDASKTYQYISAGNLRCTCSVRTVPANKKIFVSSLYAGSSSGSAAAKAIIRISTPTFQDVDFTSENTFIPLFSAAFQDNSSGLTIPCPLVFTEGQTIAMTYEIDKAATITGSWFGWMENA